MTSAFSSRGRSYRSMGDMDADYMGRKNPLMPDPQPGNMSMDSATPPVLDAAADLENAPPARNSPVSANELMDAAEETENQHDPYGESANLHDTGERMTSVPTDADDAIGKDRKAGWENLKSDIMSLAKRKDDRTDEDKMSSVSMATDEYKRQQGGGGMALDRSMEYRGIPQRPEVPMRKPGRGADMVRRW